jgi:predicted CopG family antitoxin
MRKIFDLVIEFLFRRKTLTYIIWGIITAIIAELHAISINVELIQMLDIIANKYDNSLVDIICLSIKFLIGSGSVLTLIVLICLFIIVAYLKYIEIKQSPVHEYLLDKNAQNELLYNVIGIIQKSQMIDRNSYISLKSIVEENCLSQKLDYYYKFERKRGNIHLLEQYVNNSNIINELSNLIYNEI